MEYIQLTLNDWLGMKKELERELQSVKQSFVRIGYFLRKIDDSRAYEQDGYKSVAEFAKVEYGLEASTVSRFMQINKRFSIDGYSERLLPEYKDFKRMHLEEMLKLPENDYSMIRPDTSREGIRELKKFNKEQPERGVADDIDQLLEKFFADNTELKQQLLSAPRDNIKALAELVNPSGNRCYRKGMFFMAMHENDISIKGKESGRQDIKWEEFFERTWRILEQEEENEPEQTSASSGNIEEVPVFTRQKTESEIVRESESRPGIAGTTGGDEADSEERTGESITEYAGDNVRGITGTDEVATVSEPERARKADGTTKFSEKPKGKKAAEEIAPAQKVPVNTRQKPISETKIELPKEEPQVPGQREISDYEGVVPEYDGVAPNDFADHGKIEENVSKQEETVPEIIVEEKRWTRKEYLDDCTPYGAAVYFYRWFRDEHEEAMEIISDMKKLEQWMKDKVDSNGREE